MVWVHLCGVRLRERSEWYCVTRMFSSCGKGRTEGVKWLARASGPVLIGDAHPFSNGPRTVPRAA